MIQVTPVHHDITEHSQTIRSHVLTPRVGVTIMFTIQGKNESILSIIESHFLETISSTEWNNQTNDDDFTFLTEHYNQFIKNLDASDLSQISIILGALKNTTLIISAIGNATAYLIEGEDVSQITSTEKDRYDFHLLTSGEVSRNSTIYLASSDIQQQIGQELLIEFSNLDPDEFIDIASAVFDRESDFPIHLTRITHTRVAPRIQQHTERKSPAAFINKLQLQSLKQNSIKAVHSIKNHQIWGKISDKMNCISLTENVYQKYTFLLVGVVILGFLIYVIVKMFSAALTPNNDISKENILKAKTLIEESHKLSGNPEAFERKIKEAQTLLFELRKEEKYLADTQELQKNIEIIKKEFYNIQSIELEKKDPIISFAESNIEAFSIIENKNKFSVIGRNGIITNYARGEKLGNMTSFAQGNQAISFDNLDNGTPYILMQNKKIFTLKQSNISPIYVSDGKGWESGGVIRTYNDNLYILNESKTQIYRHKPGINGFSKKSDALTKALDTEVLDFAIDGGFYLLQKNGKIMRGFYQVDPMSLTLNNTNGTWNINENEASQIIASHRLSYVYVRNGNKLWVFEPNIKNDPRSITALTQIAQLDIQASDPVQSISVFRDGTIYVTTSKGAYEVNFKVTDQKLTLIL